MTRLVVHVGMAKTATTALQTFAWSNREPLAAAGLSYCTGFRRRNHAELAVAFSSKITPLTKAEGVSSPGDRLALRRRLPAMLGDPHSAPAHFVTTEHLSTLVREQEDIDALAETLRSLYDEVQVLMVVRRADYWTPSAYVEAVKAGERRLFDEGFISRRWFVLDHLSVFERWGKAFGEDNVHAVPFLESDKADAKRIPTRLLAAAGVPAETAMQWPLPPKVANTSLSAYATELLRRLNHQRPDDGPMRVIAFRPRVVTTLRDNWPGSGPLLTPEAAAELHQRGWVRTGIETSPHAIGDGWTEWAAQPDAPTGPPADVSDDDVRRLETMLREMEIIDRNWLRLAPRRARRVARRLLSR